MSGVRICNKGFDSKGDGIKIKGKVKVKYQILHDKNQPTLLQGLANFWRLVNNWRSSSSSIGVNKRHFHVGYSFFVPT